MLAAHGRVLARRACGHAQTQQVRNTGIMANLGRYMGESNYTDYYNNYFDRTHIHNRPETFQILDNHVMPQGVPIDETAPNLEQWRKQLEAEGKQDPFWWMSAEERCEFMDNTREYCPTHALPHDCRYSADVTGFYGRSGGDVTSPGARFLLAIKPWAEMKWFAWIPLVFGNNKISMFGRWTGWQLLILSYGMVQMYVMIIWPREGREREKKFYFSRVNKSYKQGVNYDQKVATHRE
ncbi:unnamed protein product [Amoebophrya sp. A120]|nr:unnamed protein product [Amoebophrya sp. A120]|eukprot:GSA120T00016643001.1